MPCDLSLLRGGGHKKRPTTLQALKGVIEDNTYRRPGPRGVRLAILVATGFPQEWPIQKTWNLVGDKISRLGYLISKFTYLQKPLNLNK